MLCIAAELLCSVQTAGPDPNLLPIGRSGTATVAPTQVIDLRSGETSDLEGLVTAAEGKRFVFLGEQHATADHQAMEAAVIRSLVNHGRQVIVGVEMYTRPKQDVLDHWTAGDLSEDQFLEQSDWKGQWGYDFAFYRPVFSVIKELRVPVVALNVPRDWVRTVGRSGFDGLPTSARLQLPPKLGLDNHSHREVFESLMGGHSMTGTSMDRMYEAQVLWDEAMADTAVKYLARHTVTPQTVFVVIAGAGHSMYGQGINYRVGKARAGSGITMVMLQSDTPVKVSRGIADFVYVSSKPAK